MSGLWLAGRDWISARTVIDGIVRNSDPQGVEPGAKSDRNNEQSEVDRHEILNFET